jgi:MFS family permease
VKGLTGLYRDAYSGLSRDLWILAFVTLVNRSGTMVLPFLSLYLTEARGLAPREAGALVGLYGFGAVLGAYLGGFLSDRFGTIRAQQTSLLGGGLGYLLLSALDSRILLASALFAVGAIVESFRPAMLASVAERARPENQARAFAFLRLAANLGVGVGPALGGLLALYDYHWLFYADAGTCWLAALVLFRLTPGKARRGEDRRTTPEGRGSGSPWSDGPFLALTLLVVLIASVLFQVFSTFPLYLRAHLGVREDGIGRILAFNAFLIVASEMVLIHVLSGRDRMSLLGFGAFALCFGYGLMPFGDGVPWVLVTVAVWTFGEMLALPILNVVVAARAPSSHRGQYMGVYTMAFSIAFILAPVAGTYVYDRFGSDALWYGIGGLGFILWIAALRLRRSLFPERPTNQATSARGASEDF